MHVCVRSHALIRPLIKPRSPGRTDRDIPSSFVPMAVITHTPIATVRPGPADIVVRHVHYRHWAQLRLQTRVPPLAMATPPAQPHLRRGSTCATLVSGRRPYCECVSVLRMSESCCSLALLSLPFRIAV